METFKSKIPKVTWSKWDVKRPKLLPRSDHTLMLWKIKGVLKKKTQEKTVPQRFRLKLLLHIREMSKSIGHGKNSKKKKTAKNWQKILRFRKKLVNKSSSKRIYSSKVSWSNLELKMTSTWNLWRSRMITSKILSNLCKVNSLIWEWITVTSLIKLKPVSCKSAKKF